MMLDRLAGNETLKESVARMLEARRLTHSLLLVGEPGLGKGFAARCIAADYLYPAEARAPNSRSSAAPPERSFSYLASRVEAT